MRSSPRAASVQPALQHLNDLLDQTSGQVIALRPLPNGVYPDSIRDVVYWACKGFDVQPAVKMALSDPDNPRLGDWGYSYGRRLARRWVQMLNELPQDALMDRWHGAVAALNSTHRDYARTRLLDEVRKALLAPLDEREVLVAAMQEPVHRRPARTVAAH